MKARIRRVGVFQMGKVFAILDGAAVLIYLPTFVLSILPEPSAVELAIAGGILVGFPIAGVVFGLFWGVVINIVLWLAGGVVYEFEKVSGK